MINNKEVNFTDKETNFENAVMQINGVQIGTKKQWEELTTSQKKEVENLLNKFFKENTIRECKAKNALLFKDRLSHYECSICKEKKATIHVYAGDWGEYSLNICLDCLQYEKENNNE